MEMFYKQLETGHTAQFLLYFPITEASDSQIGNFIVSLL